MKVTVKLYGVLQLDRFEQQEMDVAEGACVADVASLLDLPRVHVDILLVNGAHVKAERKLQAGDVLSILPMVEGG
ncbi:MAG: MoaD/ThiS family protein [Desulfuromonadales bacterium]|nr:MoaD/ThiS family protein [Desulfuromonadales bacterium]